MIERRTTTRRRVCLGGRIEVAAFLPAIDCRIRDVSLGGAKLRLPEAACVPERFDLVVPCRGETRRAVVTWRAGDTLGLAFDPTPADPVSVAGNAEVARLRAALLTGNGSKPGGVH